MGQGLLRCHRVHATSPPSVVLPTNTLAAQHEQLWQGDVDDRKKEIVRPRKGLNPRPLHIGRMDLVIEGCSRILGSVRYAGGIVRAARIGMT
jgi:heat shock protein HslJ